MSSQEQRHIDVPGMPSALVPILYTLYGNIIVFAGLFAFDDSLNTTLTAQILPWTLGVGLVFSYFIWWLYIKNIRYHRLFMWYLDKNNWKTDPYTAADIYKPEHLMHQISAQSVSFYEFVGVQQIGNTIIRVGYIEFIRSPLFGAFHPPVVYFSVTLPKTVDGWVRIFSVDDPVVRYIRDIDLESIRLNESTYLEAEPKKLATYAFSPNVMSAYLDMPDKPWVHLEGDMVCVASMAKPDPLMLDRMVEQLVILQKQFMTSGAFEKKQGLQ